jgi:hypothetical protein
MDSNDENSKEAIKSLLHEAEQLFADALYFVTEAKKNSEEPVLIWAFCIQAEDATVNAHDKIQSIKDRFKSLPVACRT